MNNSRRTLYPPLTAQTYAIIVTIASRPLNAYSIRQHINHNMRGLSVGSGTMNQALKRMLSQGWISDTEMAKVPFYQLTDKGRTRLEKEVQRLRGAANLGEIALNGGRVLQ